MRNSVLLLFSLLCCILSAQGQTLSSNLSQLDFGQKNELSFDSLEVVVRNPLNRTVQIIDILFFDTYGSPAFSTPTKSYSIAEGDSQKIKVYFQVRHNVAHNSEMLILTDSDRGSLSIDLTGQGIYSKNYYSSTRNKEEEALKSALKSRLAQGYIQLSYNQARDNMYMVIDNWKENGRGSAENKTVGAYTGRVASPYSNRSQAQVNFQFDTEHIFPQGRFSQNLPMRSDIFHLTTTWSSANSTRGNLNFGNVTSADWQNGGSKRGNGVFEPRDEQKGRNARAMFYFVVRYQNYQSHMTTSEENVLRQWHKDFPPDDIDRKRNEDIFGVQGNRNPFIDYPQLLERISSIRSNSTAPNELSIFLSENLIDYDTVFAQNNEVYQYVIVNDGNQDLQLSNLSLADSYLEFLDNSGANLSLAPGESHSLKIRLRAPANSNLQSSLNFETNVSGQEQISIPINAISVGANSIQEEFEANYKLEVYPNPASKQLTINFKEGQEEIIYVGLYSLKGKEVKAERSLRIGMQSILSLEGLPAGYYLLRFKTDSHTGVRKIQIF
ncbi:MAG: endonuclease [Bacteroidia bacterium]|nr:endonuclease [Bacteroidia bacterium]